MTESYKVVRKFKDTKHSRVYEVGDPYPAEGHKATKARLKELSTGQNKYGKTYIEEVAEKE